MVPDCWLVVMAKSLRENEKAEAELIQDDQSPGRDMLTTIALCNCSFDGFSSE